MSIAMEPEHHHSFRSVYLLTVHLVFVTKYRRKIFKKEHIQKLESIFKSICDTRGCIIVEFNGEDDHVHLIVDYPPKLSISNLVANLKSTSSKLMWLEFESYLKTIYWKEKVLWTGSYFAASCGGVTIEKLKQYVQRQDSPTT
jgi:putative transposase